MMHFSPTRRRHVAPAILVGLLLLIGPSTAIAQSTPRSVLDGDCNVASYGAISNDGIADTAAFQNAIDNCKGRGGRVVVPSGQWDIGGIELGSDMEFHVRAGGVVRLIPDISKYQLIAPESGPGAGLMPFYTAIYAPNAQNLTISGPGIINGSGPGFWDENFYELGIGRPTLPRPQPVMELADCSNVHVRGLRFENMPAYALRFNRCDDVSAVDVHIRNDIRSPNTDGIQIRDTSNALITRADIVTGDDAIVLKSDTREVRNVVVSDSIVESDDGAIKFGTKSDVGIVDTLFSNIVITNSRFGISLFMVGGGEYRNNRFENVIIRTGGRRDRQYPIYADIDRTSDDGDYGSIDGLVFSGISIASSGTSLIGGNSDAPIRNLVLRDISLFSADELFDVTSGGRKPRGNRSFRAQEGSEDFSREPAHFVLANIEGLAISDVYIDQPDQSVDWAAISLINVSDAVVRGVQSNSSEQPLVQRRSTEIHLKDLYGRSASVLADD